MAAHQGDGAHAQAQQGAFAEQRGDGCADDVLAQHQHGGQGGEQKHGDRALLQQLEAGAEADAGEEEVHERGFQNLFKLEFHDTRLIDNQVGDGEHQSADDGGGDAAALQELHTADDEASQQEQHHGQSGGLQHVHR